MTDVPGLRIQEMLEFKPDQGRILLGGSRVILVSSSALGMLRRDLISVLGQERARGFLLRYGWSCGYNDAISVRQQNPDCSDDFWSKQGPLLHTLEGVVHVDIRVMEFDRARGHYFVEGTWTHSYEAEEHLRQLGHAEEPVCWTLVGYGGGYTTAVVGRQVVFKEVRCVAKGDSHCQFVGRTVDAWGPAIEDELVYYGESKIAEELEEAHRRSQAQHRLLQQIMAMHDELSRLVLDGKGRQALVETVGRMLGAAVSVEDRYLRPLAVWVPPDDAPVPGGYLLGPLAQEVPGVRERLLSLQSTRRSVELGPDLHPGLHARSVTPIILGSEVMGYLSIFPRRESNPDLLRMVTERAAAVMGLELVKERTAIETEHRLKGDFIEEVLSASASAESVRSRARYLGYDLDRPHRFLLVHPDRALPSVVAPGGPIAPPVENDLFDLVRTAIPPAVDRPLVVERGGGILVLLPTGTGGADPRQTASAIQQQVRQLLRGAVISVCISREARSMEELPGAYQEARSALAVKRSLGAEGAIYAVEDLGSFEVLYSGAGKEALLALARRLLGPVLAYDQRHDGKLIPTLHSFLDQECNLQRTADAMSLSLSGLRYRLQRARELAGFDLDDPQVRFDLRLALKALLAAGEVRL